MPKIPSDKTEPKYQLFNEDCFETFKRIPPKSIDLVLCDPPYGTTRCKWDSVIPLEPMWRELRRVSKNSLTILHSSQPFTSILITSQLDRFKYELIWVKERPSSPGVAKYRPLPYHETICVFGCSKTLFNPQMGIGKPFDVTTGKTDHGHGFGFKNGKTYRVVNPGTRYPKSVLEFTTQRNNVHPTQKPVALMEYLIKTYTNPGDTVLDFAMGSGTTGVACGNLGRRFIGCDNDTEHGYFEIAKKRIQEAYKQGEGNDER